MSTFIVKEIEPTLKRSGFNLVAVSEETQFVVNNGVPMIWKPVHKFFVADATKEQLEGLVGESLEITLQEYRRSDGSRGQRAIALKNPFEADFCPWIIQGYEQKGSSLFAVLRSTKPSSYLTTEGELLFSLDKIRVQLSSEYAKEGLEEFLAPHLKSAKAIRIPCEEYSLLIDGREIKMSHRVALTSEIGIDIPIEDAVERQEPEPQRQTQSPTRTRGVKGRRLSVRE